MKKPVHPGEILKEEFLRPLEMSVYELAKRIGVPAPRVNDIVLKRRGITPETAVLLARVFGTTDRFWINLQIAYVLPTARCKLASRLKRIKPLENKMITRWVQTEEEQRELGLKSAGRSVFEDKNGKFWFGDETECDVCGPFDTRAQCLEALREYAKTL